MESKEVKLIKAESDGGFQGLGAGGNGEMLIKGTKFQVCRMSKSWRANAQHSDYNE